MIELIGELGTAEYEAARSIYDRIVAAWPDVVEDGTTRIWLIPNARCYGNGINDVDILLLVDALEARRSFRPLYGMVREVDTGAVEVRGLCAIVEVKSHDPEGVRFQGNSVLVRYTDHGRVHWENASDKANRQKGALANYLRSVGLQPPWVSSLIYLRGVPQDSLPTVVADTLPSVFTFTGLLSHLASQNRVRYDKDAQVSFIDAFEGADAPDALLDLFVRELSPTQLDLAQMNRLATDRPDAELEPLVGRKLVILRGGGGTGKTIRLLHVARRLYETRGAHTLVLTYNNALVANVRRLLALISQEAPLPTAAVHIQTAHSFFYAMAGRLSDGSEAISDTEMRADADDFGSRYTTALRQALDVLTTVSISLIANNAGMHLRRASPHCQIPS